MSDLLPCPFCNSERTRIFDRGANSAVQCSRCGAIGPHAIGNHYEQQRGAEKLWNMRGFKMADEGEQ